MAGRLTTLDIIVVSCTLSLALTVSIPDHSDQGINMNHDGPLSYDNNAVHSGEFLLISSPSQHKVVWTNLQNFQSSDHRPFALVDSGLDTPKGLAFDHKRGHLYIADSGAKKIFRYTILTDISGSRPTLTTSGVRLTVTEGHPVENLAIDDKGNLFYTAPDTNNINKIEAEVLHRLAKGEFSPSMLEFVSQKKLQAEVQAKVAVKKKEKEANSTNSTNLPKDDPPPDARILSVYEASVNPHVSMPAGIAAKGDKLYWTNAAAGKTAGTVVEGKTEPEMVEDSKDAGSGNATSALQIKPFKASSLSEISTGAYSIAVSEKVVFFTRNRTALGQSDAEAEAGVVSGLLMGSEIILDFVSDLARPRGLVWDKDQTVYVADQSGGHVWSFPVGRMMTHAPLTEAVEMEGAYGLEILSNKDPCFNKNMVDSDGELSKTEEIATETINQGEDPLDPDENGFLGKVGGFLQGREQEMSAAFRGFSAAPLAFTILLLARAF
jgi:sugar lactone lactonase YvrE